MLTFPIFKPVALAISAGVNNAHASLAEGVPAAHAVTELTPDKSKSGNKRAALIIATAPLDARSRIEQRIIGYPPKKS